VAKVCFLGPKLIGNARRHTVIGYAQPFLHRFGQWGEVERIGGGPITAGRAKRGVKIWRVEAGLQIKIYDTSEAQVFFLYTHQREIVMEKLRGEFESCEVVS